MDIYKNTMDYYEVDAKYFMQQGHSVDAVDGSKELCRLASEYTGIEVRNMFFQKLAEVEKYRGEDKWLNLILRK